MYIWKLCINIAKQTKRTNICKLSLHNLLARKWIGFTRHMLPQDEEYMHKEILQVICRRTEFYPEAIYYKVDTKSLAFWVTMSHRQLEEPWTSMRIFYTMKSFMPKYDEGFIRNTIFERKDAKLGPFWTLRRPANFLWWSFLWKLLSKLSTPSLLLHE